MQRIGTKKKPFYRVVAVDERKRRDGSIIEKLGKYHPIAEVDQFEVDEEKVFKWLKYGAQPTNTILRLLKKQGLWAKHINAK